MRNLGGIIGLGATTVDDALDLSDELSEGDFRTAGVLLGANVAFRGKLPRKLRNKLERIKHQSGKAGSVGILGALSGREALSLGVAFVGPGFRATSDGIGLISKDGLRLFKFPKNATNEFTKTGRQANFVKKLENGRFSNVHIDIK